MRLFSRRKTAVGAWELDGAGVEVGAAPNAPDAADYQAGDTYSVSYVSSVHRNAMIDVLAYAAGTGYGPVFASGPGFEVWVEATWMTCVDPLARFPGITWAATDFDVMRKLFPSLSEASQVAEGIAGRLAAGSDPREVLSELDKDFTARILGWDGQPFNTKAA